MNNPENAIEHLDDIKFQIRVLQNDIYLICLNGLLLRGVLVDDARQQSIEFVEKECRLQPGTFTPLLNMQDTSFWDF